jgi:hypothetical protein
MNVSQSVKQSFSRSFTSLKSQKGLLYIVVTVMALIAFEAFNFGTTEYALTDLLGSLKIFGFQWSTLLSIAFCAIDFTGIAKLFAPQTGKRESSSSWYMFGAWILAATMNAILTWWGVVMAMENHSVLSAAIVDASFVGKAVPIFIALVVWVIRILLIGSLSKNEDRQLKETGEAGPAGLSRREFRQAQSKAVHAGSGLKSVPSGFRSSAAANSSNTRQEKRPEATYIPIQEETSFRTLNASGRQGRRI